MIEPEDFGLNAVQTLATVGSPELAPGFLHYWTRWREAAFSIDPRLEPIENQAVAGASGAPGITHTFNSTRHARIGCCLHLPESGTPSAAVVSLHGYEMVPSAPCEQPRELVEAGLAVLTVRLRGYPGSIFDNGPLHQHPQGYITLGLETEDDWIMSGAVADAVSAFRALRARFGAEFPISLMGDSFGAAVALLAASQIQHSDRVYRAALALPTLGNWPWRLASPTLAGTGREVAGFLTAHRDREEPIRNNLRYYDTAVHARRVLCPVLMKLATRDDVVPAPAAASVFNALGSDPSLKWRFLTRYGHFDGGLADARRHALYRTLAAQFLNPRVRINELMSRWEPVLTDMTQGRPPG